MNDYIDIIIPFYNQHHLLARCLRSVEASGFEEGKVIIVDDNSEPAAADEIRELSSQLQLEIEILSHETNRGFRDSILTGVKQTDTPYLILLNSDTVVSQQFATKLVVVMQDAPSIAAVAPISNHPTDLYQFREWIYLRSDFDREGHQKVLETFEPYLKQRPLKSPAKEIVAGQEITIVPYLSGCSLALNRSVFEQVGFLHGTYEHGYLEDMDLSCRIRERGYQLAVQEDCFVYHRGQGSYGKKSVEWRTKIILNNYEVFKAQWGHLAEHDDLEAKMKWAGEQYPMTVGDPQEIPVVDAVEMIRAHAALLQRAGVNGTVVVDSSLLEVPKERIIAAATALGSAAADPAEMDAFKEVAKSLAFFQPDVGDTPASLDDIRPDGEAWRTVVVAEMQEIQLALTDARH